jgi:choloylglycine hydrolase
MNRNMGRGRERFGDSISGPAAPARALLVALVALISPGPAAPSTAFVIKNADALVLARNFDWPVGAGHVVVNKREVVKSAFVDPASAPLRWTSKYGSVTFNPFGREFPLGGINEEGLVIEALTGPAGYPAPDRRPAVSELQWVQYQLDSHRSVKEVLRSEAGLRVARLLLSAHFLVADRWGAAAVIEFEAGKIAVHRGNELPVRVLSEMGYAESIDSLRSFRGFGGSLAVPNGPGPGERFARAAAILDDFGWPLRGILSDYAFTVLKSLEQPDTQWSVVYNIPRRLILFKTKARRRLKLVSLEDLDFSCRTPVLILPVETAEGWVVNDRFVPYNPQRNLLLLEDVFSRLREAGGGAGAPALTPADEIIRKMAGHPESSRCR